MSGPPGPGLPDTLPVSPQGPGGVKGARSGTGEGKGRPHGSALGTELRVLAGRRSYGTLRAAGPPPRLPPGLRSPRRASARVFVTAFSSKRKMVRHALDDGHTDDLLYARSLRKVTLLAPARRRMSGRLRDEMREHVLVVRMRVMDDRCKGAARERGGSRPKATTRRGPGVHRDRHAMLAHP